MVTTVQIGKLFSLVTMVLTCINPAIVLPWDIVPTLATTVQNLSFYLRYCLILLMVTMVTTLIMVTTRISSSCCWYHGNHVNPHNLTFCPTLLQLRLLSVPPHKFPHSPSCYYWAKKIKCAVLGQFSMAQLPYGIASWSVQWFSSWIIRTDRQTDERMGRLTRPAHNAFSTCTSCKERIIIFAFPNVFQKKKRQIIWER